MKHLGLFEGIGGFSLAARWAGWETIAWCEWNEFGQKILRHHFPNAEGHGDITKTDFTKYKNAVDIITGGFPCQPYSSAGKRKGKDDERHLWPEMLRAIREVQPSYVVGENVRGLTNWNGGLVFDEVQADLETQGFEVLPFLLPACAKNAPHQRDRIWFIAHSKSNRDRRILRGLESQNGGERKPEKRRENNNEFRNDGKKRNATNTGSEGLPLNSCGEQREIYSEVRTSERREPGGAFTAGVEWRNFPTQSPVCGRNDGLSRELDGITFSKWRTESLKAYGNAIVPQVAYEIFKAINACGGTFV